MEITAQQRQDLIRLCDQPIRIYSPSIVSIRYAPLVREGLVIISDIGSDAAQETILKIEITSAGRSALTQTQRPRTMKVISYNTAGQIACAHKEIEAAETLLAELEKAESGRELPDLRDAFGRRRGIQLGVPSGESSHRCFNVDPRLAIVVLRAHVASQRSLIEALSQQAASEMSATT